MIPFEILVFLTNSASPIRYGLLSMIYQKIAHFEGFTRFGLKFYSEHIYEHFCIFLSVEENLEYLPKN